MRTLAHVLSSKGSTVWATTPDTTVYAALQQMARHNVGALLVIEGGTPVGMLSERDYARKIVLEGRSSLDTPVRVVMTTPLTACPSSYSIDAAMGLMTRARVRHLPVLDDGHLRGMVSIGDLVKARFADQQFVIDQLENYIAT